MVDLTALFALGEGLARQAITTAGTRVRVETRTETTDPDTLERTTATDVLGEYPAIVAALNHWQVGQPLPGVEVRPGDWRVVLTSKTPPPPVGAWIVVTRSRNPNLVDRDARVLGGDADSAGAVVTAYARPGAIP